MHLWNFHIVEERILVNHKWYVYVLCAYVCFKVLMIFGTLKECTLKSIIKNYGRICWAELSHMENCNIIIFRDFIMYNA